MLNDNLTDFEAARCGEHRDEAVEFTVKSNLAKNFRLVAFHAAVMVVQLDAGQPPHQCVEDSARQDFMPGIMPRLLPAADHVKTRLHGLEKIRDFGRIILQISIERDEDFALRRSETRRQRRRLAEIPAQADAVYVAMVLGELGDYLPRAVGAAVVDENDLVFQVLRCRNLLLEEL